jgi:hypothetical protein
MTCENTQADGRNSKRRQVIKKAVNKTRYSVRSGWPERFGQFALGQTFGGIHELRYDSLCRGALAPF